MKSIIDWFKKNSEPVVAETIVPEPPKFPEIISEDSLVESKPKASIYENIVRDLESLDNSKWSYEDEITLVHPKLKYVVRFLYATKHAFPVGLEKILTNAEKSSLHNILIEHYNYARNKDGYEIAKRYGLT